MKFILGHYYRIKKGRTPKTCKSKELQIVKEMYQFFDHKPRKLLSCSKEIGKNVFLEFENTSRPWHWNEDDWEDNDIHEKLKLLQ